MPPAYQTFVTQGFKRDVRRITRRNPSLASIVGEMISTLEEDPHNTTGRHNIKKLTSVKAGDGQWRIRSGDYRLRYDLHGNDIILFSFRHRREAY